MRLRRSRPPAPVDIAGATDRGRRPENQDRWAAGPHWAVVCDGVGGHAGGATAARTARDAVVAHLHGPPPATVADGERRLRDAAAAANGAVVAGRATDPAAADMATTLTAALAVTGRHRRWVVLQVGDSPAWVVGPSGARSVTADHSLAGELVRAGAITPEQALGHSGRHVVTRALGPLAAVEPELHVVDLGGDESLVLLSDGLSDVALPDAAVAPLATGGAGAGARALVALALARGTMDNVTVVVAR